MKKNSTIPIVKKLISKTFFFFLFSLLLTTAKAQVINEGFEEAGWVTSAGAATSVYTINDAGTGSINNGTWSGNNASVNTNVNSTITGSKYFFIAGSSSAFLITPLIPTGVSQVTLKVRSATGTLASIIVGFATNLTVTNNTGSISSTGANNAWTIQSSTWANMPHSTNSYSVLTFNVTNTLSTNPGYVKIQRISTGSLIIDDIVITSPTSVPSLTTTAISALTDVSASSGGTINSNGGSAITEKGVVWGISPNPEIPSVNSTSDGSGVAAYSSSITGLSAGTTYYVRAFATNTTGTGYGNELMFTTSVPTTDYYNVAASDISLLSSWGTNTDGTGTNPADFTTDGQLFNLINTGATISAPLTISGTGSKLIIGDGTNPVSFTSNQAFTATVDVLAQATFTNQSIVNPTFGDIDVNSTINFDGVGLTAAVENYGNLGLLNDAQLPVGAVGVAGVFSPGITTTAVAGNAIVFNGTIAQTIPAFAYDSLAVTNAAGASTAAASSIDVNRGLKVSGPLNIIAGSDVDLFGLDASLVVDATRVLTVNGNLTLKSLKAPTVTGSLVVNSGGKYVVDANVGNATGFIPTATYNAGSVIEVLQGGPRIPAVIGGSVIWNSVGAGSFVNSASNTIDENLTIKAGQVNNGSGGTGRTLTVKGNLNIEGGRYDVLGVPGSGSTNQTLNVDGNVNITSGSLFASAGTTGTGVGIINIKGNLNHSGGSFGDSNIVNTTGRIVFNGTTNQNISTIGLSDTVDVSINNAAGVTLLTDLDSLVGTLTLTSGLVTTGANKVIVRGNGTVVRTAGHINGNLQKFVPIGTPVSKSFEVGDATIYAPVTIAFADVSIGGDVTASTTAGDHPQIASSQIDQTLSVNRFWTVSNSGVVFTTYDATFNFDPTDLDGSANTATFIVGDYDGGNWTYPTVGTLTGTSSQITGATSFSDFAIGNLQVPLPIRMEYIKGQKLVSGNAINWKVNCTSNRITMKIERSSDGRMFTELESITADKVRCAQPFNFVDATPLSGVNYYRLRLVDLDGKTTYSATVAVINGAQGFQVVGVFPSLVRNQTFVSISSSKSSVVETITTDVHGRVVSKLRHSVTNGSNMLPIDFSTLSKGVYTISVIAEGSMQSPVRVVKY